MNDNDNQNHFFLVFSFVLVFSMSFLKCSYFLKGLRDFL